MQASDYSDKERFQLGVVELVQKAKNCGKENCAACPHEGYWYARVPAFFTVKGHGVEVYLGRGWTGEELRKKVAGYLREDKRAQLLEMIDRQETQEQIAALVDGVAKVEADRRHVENEFKRQVHLLDVRHARLKADIVEAQKRLKQLGKGGSSGR